MNLGKKNRVLDDERYMHINLYQENVLLDKILLHSKMVVGQKGADIVLNDPFCSHRHCTFEVTNQTVILTDLGSTNGTFVNEKQVRKMILHSGDVVRIGKTYLTLEGYIFNYVEGEAPNLESKPAPEKRGAGLIQKLMAKVPKEKVKKVLDSVFLL